MKLDNLIKEAMGKGGSDIHLTTGRPPTFRVDGILVLFNDEKLTSLDIEEVVDEIVHGDQKTILQKTGEVDFAYSVAGIGRFRVNVFTQRGSYAMALRLLPFEIPSPKKLGIPESVVEMVNKKRGLVLVTGATGSGKSTTLASLINEINQKYAYHIITLEDPIEYLHKHNKSIVNQREIGTDTKSYANALRAALRQDPDVILVGEMRDLDTISIAVTAAETGHLVFSTLHTMGAANTIERIIDVFPPYQQQQIRIQLSTVLECVVCQQLIPTDDGMGRVAAFEVMLANSAIRNLIRETKTFQIPSTIQTAKKSGMQLMDDALYDLFIEGRISKEMAISYAGDPISLQRKVY
ncbi:type IV pilus twitching motility protein PilT [Lachnotalea glycerini]|uniref:Type IV pilus twitching motility protein PilT n=1 Tax=Lachnotalea glycerini TaxID=1763509 RepID=A0A371JH07_9FIRM|nr:type IV pilus twitching motility protein PilT [Lachnotalea glycerini]